MTIDIKDLWTNLSSRQRMLVIVAIGTVLFSAIYYVASAQVANQPDSAQNSAPHKNAVQAPPAMPQGYLPDSTLHNPFAGAPVYQQPAGVSGRSDGTGGIPDKGTGTNPSSSAGRANSQAKTVKEEKPALTGIVGGDGKQLAIIEYKSESRSYRVKDYVGPYQVLAVDEHAVTLWGPDGNLALTLGR